MDNRYEGADWSAIVLTAANQAQAQVYRQELLLRQRRGLIPEETLCLSVPDPASARVGSGGATLNALLAVSEYLSARAGRAYISADTIQDTKILVLHSGGDGRRVPQSSVTGKSFVSLPILADDGEMLAPLDMLLRLLSRICASAPSGMFVASGDVILTVLQDHFDWSRPGVTGLAIPTPKAYGSHHGVYRLEPGTQRVDAFFQKASQPILEEQGVVRDDETVLIDCGVIYLCSRTTERFLNCHVTPPFDACTYLGVDSGAPPARFELYSDFLLGLADVSEREAYMAETCDDPGKTQVREFLWQTMRDIPFQAVVAEGGEFLHLGTTEETIDFFTANTHCSKTHGVTPSVQSFIEHAESVKDAVVINSLLVGSGSAGQHAVIENSELHGNWSIGKRAFCSGIRSFSGLRVGDQIVVQEVGLQPTSGSSAERVLTVFGVTDNPKHPYTDSRATVANYPWSSVFERSGVQPDAIWPETPPEKRSLWNAKLFPVLSENEWPDHVLWLQDADTPSVTAIRRWRKAERVSFADILKRADLEKELRWRRNLHFRVLEHRIEAILWDRKDESLLPIFASFAREDRLQVLELLDGIALDSPYESSGRVFASVADALATFAKNQGGLRSGPARNEEWRHGLELLEAGNLADAVKNLTEIRKDWLGSPELLIRASRHYEAAARNIIHSGVKSASCTSQPDSPPPLGAWVSADAPARIDLAGGWTDTPPITYEAGGTVVNAAVTVDDQRPIKVKVRRIEEPVLKFRLDDEKAPIVCRALSDLRDFDHPLAPGALLKAAVLSTGVVELDSKQTLEQQLQAGGGGLEIHSTVHLPKGSGLGTSSILGGAMIAAIAKVAGRKYDAPELVHAVTELEQRMTTGGGWQDPAGGLIPGLKYLHSPASLPLRVEIETLDVKQEILDRLNRHMVLINTGRTRLARNLVQDVVRRWFARTPEIIELTKELVRNARGAREAIVKGDLEGIGRHLARYWTQKQQMAEGVAPPRVLQMIENLRPFTYGASLTGAGGGGFLAIITREPADLDWLSSALPQPSERTTFSVHRARIDLQGLQLTSET